MHTLTKDQKKRFTSLHAAAVQVANRLNRSRFTVYKPIGSAAAFNELQRLQTELQICQSRNWLLATRLVRRQLIDAINRVQGFVVQIDEQLKLVDYDIPLPQHCHVKTIFHELASLEAEFELFEIDVKAGTISATTNDIVLEDEYLGPFEIRLHIARLGESHPYSVIARDPQPCDANDAHPHPHVQCETLCEGEGHMAIKRALEQGRLYDFFLIVRQILQSYNESSAYVTLSDWHGVECSQCGNSNDRDSIYPCSNCETQMCSDCSSSCQHCDCSYCGECIESCNDCHDSYCDRCLSECSGCTDRFCENCLTEGECYACSEQENDEAEAETEVESSARPSLSDITLHTVRLGEADLSP